MFKFNRAKTATKQSATCTECNITGLHLMSCSQWKPSGNFPTMAQIRNAR